MLSQISINNVTVFLSLKIVFTLANSADPDEMPPYAAFHLGLHCLPKAAFHLGLFCLPRDLFIDAQIEKDKSSICNYMLGTRYLNISLTISSTSVLCVCEL